MPPMPSIMTVFLPRDRFSTLVEGSLWEWVINQEGEPVPYYECPYTQSHLNSWCGNPACRQG